ncbi:hypothetical protein [Aeromonas enteropelogenes]|uniref:hypothetical protein n=1 Tax=Aeromonas enteropelogenes TaxID=29489 RepID=UPI003BA01F23
MDIELNDDNIFWVLDNKKITVLGDFIDALYDKRLGSVVALSMDSIHFFSKDGVLITIKQFILRDPSYHMYCLANELSNIGAVIRVVIAHEPPFRGERFWQHDINFENGIISEPIAQWR